MKNKIQCIFGKEHKIIIGVVHLPPLPGYVTYPGFAVAKRNALADTHAFIKGGVDGIIFENNYDSPHTEFIGPDGLEEMKKLGKEIKEVCRLPLGVNVLWNDYRANFELANNLKLQFVRVPVFVDKVRTDYGTITGRALRINKLRESMRLPKVAIFADIHVKHSVLLSKRSLTESAREAMRCGADALIVTGNWTGQAPELEKLRSLRKSIGNFPIFVGSGVDRNNIRDILKYANGVIVSTSLKKGGVVKSAVNVKNYDQRILITKVATLTKVIKIN